MHYFIYILFLFSPLCTFLQVSVSSRANLLKKDQRRKFQIFYPLSVNTLMKIL